MVQGTNFRVEISFLLQPIRLLHNNKLRVLVLGQKKLFKNCYSCFLPLHCNELLTNKLIIYSQF